MIVEDATARPALRGQSARHRRAARPLLRRRAARHGVGARDRHGLHPRHQAAPRRPGAVRIAALPRRAGDDDARAAARGTAGRQLTDANTPAGHQSRPGAAWARRRSPAPGSRAPSTRRAGTATMRGFGSHRRRDLRSGAPRDHRRPPRTAASSPSKPSPRRRRRASTPAAARSAPRSAAAIEHAEKALWRMVSYYGNALDDLDAAIAADPRWPLPHVMKANALLSMTEHGLGIDGGGEPAARRRARCRRPRQRARAPPHRRDPGVRRRPVAAGLRRLGADPVDHPQDLRRAADRAPVRLLPRRRAQPAPARRPRAARMVDARRRCYSFVLGMHAFGLEEMQPVRARARRRPARRSRSTGATRGRCTP